MKDREHFGSLEYFLGIGLEETEEFRWRHKEE